MAGNRLLRAAVIASLVLVAGALAGRHHMFGAMLQPLTLLGRIDPYAIALAVAFMVVAMLINGAVWSRLLVRLGYPLPMSIGLRAFLSAGLAGYVVNAAGPAIGCTVSLRKQGVCPTRAVLLSLIANALGFCGVLIWAPLGLVVLARSRMDTALPVLGHTGPAIAAGALVAFTIGMVVVLHLLARAPYAGSRLAHRVLHRHQPTAEEVAGRPAIALRTRQLLALAPLAAAAWLAGTLALYVILSALDGDPNPGDVAGSAAIAAVLGSLAFFVPEGMGVRDGALIAMLAHSNGMPVATCTAAALLVRALDPVLKLGLLLLLASGITRAPVWGRIGNEGRRALTAPRRAARAVGRFQLPRPRVPGIRDLE